MNNDVFLESHSIYLRAPTQQDIDGGAWHAWFNNPELTKYNAHGVFPVRREQEKKLVMDGLSDATQIILAVVSKNDNRLIGTVSLQSIDTLNKNAAIAIMIGERGQPTAAAESIGLLVMHGFSRLNLHRIYGGTHEKLIDFIWMLEVLGFRVEGRREQAICRDNVFYDNIMFRILRHEYGRICREREGGYLFDTGERLLREVLDSVKKGKDSSPHSSGSQAPR